MLGRHTREFSVLATYALLLLLLAAVSPGFFSRQFWGVAVQAAPVIVAAAGMTLVIIARQVDISIGSQFSLCAVIAGLAAKAGLAAGGVLGVTLVCGAAMGAVNGALIAFMGLPSIVVTLATMVILREGLRWARQGEAVRDLPATFQWFGLSQHAGEVGLVLGSLTLLAIVAFACRWLWAGRLVYLVGSDQEAARMAGVRPRRVTFNVFVLMGVLAALAALLNAARFPQIDVNTGNGLELQVIAAVVVGGTAISGGRGNLLGSLIGVALLTTIGPALTFLHLQPQWERAIQGAIILLAVASDGLSRDRRPA